MGHGSSKRRQLLGGLVVMARLGFGCLLLWSSLPKINHPYVFLGSVYKYELVGAKVGMLAAMTLPWLELLLGLCLISGLFLSGALLGGVILMGVFAFAQASALWRGLTIGCGCFSASNGIDLVSYGTLIRTILLLIVAMLGYICVLIAQQMAQSQEEKRCET